MTPKPLQEAPPPSKESSAVEDVPAARKGRPEAAGPAAPGGAPAERKARTIAGLVVSARMQKTIVVQVERLEKHVDYGKYIRRHSRFKAHDEKGEAREGDIVNISQTRPISRTKRWRLVSILTRAKGRVAAARDAAALGAAGRDATLREGGSPPPGSREAANQTLGKPEAEA